MTHAVQGASSASQAPVGRVGQIQRVLLGIIILALALTVVGLQVPAAAQGHAPMASTASEGVSQAELIVRIAKAHIGAGFQMGTEGHKYFDCSGFVYRVYQMAGLLDRIGGSRKGATTYYNWFRKRGLATRSEPLPGDLIAYGGGAPGRVPHIAIYIGDGLAISALNPRLGVRMHRVGGIGLPLKVYLHPRITR
ncbi:MAG: NlpC/P60 family protein [Chloroflexota bacterium]|nr:NlpC/P60 family protein [Chloroflexota bacterium]